jgi:hypothetical protein
MMKHEVWVALLGCGALLGACKDAAQQVQPLAQGQRGEACQARNDCEGGLACILGVCSKNDFELTSSAKQCDRVDCQADADCCGTKALTAPAKCDNRISICSTPTLAGCVSTTCTDSSSCGTGSCGSGYCSNGAGTCSAGSDCADTCVTNTCTRTGFSCTADADCGGVCSGRYCSCTNPEYNPTHPICTDPDCVNVCTLRCQEERCVTDTSCKTDTDCTTSTKRLCSAGNCVQCSADTDCNVSAGEACKSNVCKKPCVADEQCPLFQSCQAGDCVATGCKSDRECVLAANGDNGSGGSSSIVSSSTQDARLSKCLPSDTNPALNTCKIPCENDGSCGSEFQVCDKGFCRFIGCETDADCRAYLGIANEVQNDSQPYISRAVCRP